MKELGSALLKKVRKNEFDEEVVIAILDRYPNTFRFVEQKKSISKAFEIVKEHNTSIYDAMFIAVAMKDGYELLTCDKYQAEVARKEGVKTIEI